MQSSSRLNGLNRNLSQTAPVCGHCGADEMYDDGDRAHGIEIYACRNCGWRHYPAYPPRIGREPDEPNSCLCVGCGEWFSAGQKGANWCPHCREIVRIEHRRQRGATGHICLRCREYFKGGTTAKYCVGCVIIANRERNRRKWNEHRERVIAGRAV